MYTCTLHVHMCICNTSVSICVLSSSFLFSYLFTLLGEVGLFLGSERKATIRDYPTKPTSDGSKKY